MHFAKRAIQSVFRRAGFELSRIKDTRDDEPPKDKEQFPSDFDAMTQDLCQFVRPFTMTSPERIFALRQAVMHVIQHEIPGDIVECGVWKGGSMMAAAKTLHELGATDRDLHLFDTFSGMPAPGEKDVSFDGKSAAELMSSSDKNSSVDMGLQCACGSQA